jgi:hypothetical protein
MRLAFEVKAGRVGASAEDEVPNRTIKNYVGRKSKLLKERRRQHKVLRGRETSSGARCSRARRGRIEGSRRDGNFGKCVLLLGGPTWPGRANVPKRKERRGRKAICCRIAAELITGGDG